jgi:hypothetical protein
MRHKLLPDARDYFDSETLESGDGSCQAPPFLPLVHWTRPIGGGDLIVSGGR